MIRKLAMIPAVLLWCMAGPGLAQDSTTGTTGVAAGKTEDAVEIESDRMEIKDEENISIFTGNVIAKRPDMKLNAAKLVAHYADVKQADGSTKNEISSFDATGNVVIVTNRQKVTGNSATLNYATNDLVVTGNVTVTQGSTVLKGPKLEANLDTDKMVMTGGRVKGSFVPQ